MSKTVSSSWLVWLVVLPIRGYQRWISPAMGDHCRFAPSCSSYAVQALQTHGLLRGAWLALRRLARCHPWNAGGHDPVPAKRGLALTSQQDPATPPSRTSTTITG